MNPCPNTDAEAMLGEATASAVRHGRGFATCVEDMLDGDAHPPPRPIAPPVVGAYLLAVDDEMRPGLMLADGSVVVLGWAQMHVLREGFGAWERALCHSDPAKRSAAVASVRSPA